MDLKYIEEQWNGGGRDRTAGTEAWDSVAESYVRDSRVNFSDDSFLRFMADKVDITPDMKVLDVGCGAGAYSFAIAERAGLAVGVDYSPGMIEKAKEYASEIGCTNAEFYQRNWYTCDSSEFEGKYDIVFAHTTPAVADYGSFMKMFRAGTGYGFMCKPTRRHDPVLDELKALLGLPAAPADDSPAYIFSILWSLGCRPEFSYHDTVWKSERDVESAEKWYLGRLREYCSMDSEKEEKVRSYLAEISEGGLVKENIQTCLMNIFWRY